MDDPVDQAGGAEQRAFHELCYYTLAHGDPAFIHQHVIDAFAAQNANEQDKPIKVTFALVGLYLHVEKQYTGRHVQRVHMTLGQKKQAWPTWPLPADRGSITAVDVLAVPAGPERDDMIHQWCVSVWSAFRDSREALIALLATQGESRERRV